MKKIVASVGLVALGASSLHAFDWADFTAESTKPWSVGLTLRGFYDDNINTWPNSQPLPPGYKKESWGFEVSPSINFDWKLEQTQISLGYTYSYKWYENKPVNSTDNSDQAHIINAAIDHTFNENLHLNVHDSFVIGQEPDMLRAGNTFSTFQRVSGDNMRNFGAATLDGKITPLLGYEVGYDNAWYNYADTGGDATSPSTGGLLNRIEQNIHIDSRWQLQPETVGVVGYNFRDADYTADEVIGVDSYGGTINPIYSQDRNSHSHMVYAGLDHTFRPDLTGSLRGGAEFVDYYNSPYTGWDVSPYVRLSLRWTYLSESYLEFGYTYDVNATDVLTGPLGSNQSGFTTSAESSVVWLNVKHKLAHQLYLGVQGQFQNSNLQNGYYNNDTEQYYLAGVNLEYKFTRNFSGQVGYNYDNLDSEVPGRSFDRNRVYLGLTASY